jgi:hypothetical protein
MFLTSINKKKALRKSGLACHVIFLVLGAGACVNAQTLVDLSTQSKNVDFSRALSTKPVQVASTLPASCLIGQLIFLLTAPPGQNLYGCTAPNIWSQLTGGANASAANILAGFGILLLPSTIPGLTYVTIDTAAVLSRLAGQASTHIFCRSSTGNTTYTCALNPTLLTYTGPSSEPPGSTCLVLFVDVLGGAGATLEVDHLGPRPILERSGEPLVSGDIPAGQPVPVCFNGLAFVLSH